MVEIINPLKDPKWDAFVEKQPNGWICHLSGWKKALQYSFPHLKSYYLILHNEHKEIIAALPLFEMRSLLTGKRLVSIPYTTICDPLISSQKDIELLINHAHNLSNILGIPHIEIKAISALNYLEENGFSGLYWYKNHYIDLSLDLKQIWNSFHRKAVRQEINRTKRYGFQIRFGETEADLHSFYKLYINTRKYLGLPTHPFSFINSLWQVFQDSGRIRLFLCIYDGKPIAGHILYFFNGRVSAEFEAWDRKFSRFSPNHFLFWEEIQIAHKEGFKIFDFGRTSPEDYGLMQFKKYWGTKIIDLPIYYTPSRPFDKQNSIRTSLAYRLARNLCRVTPKSIHPWMGKFLFRYM